MNPWPKTVFLLLLTLSMERHAVAQLENHMQTYDLTLEDCLAATFRQNPEIQRLRADVEGAVGTRLVYRSRALPKLSAEVLAGMRGGDLYNPLQIKTITNTNGTVFATNSAAQLYPQPFSLMTAEFSQPLIDVGIPPSLRRGKLEVVLAQQNLNREVTERLYEARVTFLEALYLRDLIALYDEIDQRLQRNVDSEQQRFDVGTGNEGAVKSARIQELNQKLDLADLRNRYFTAITRLAELGGRDLRDVTNAASQLRLPKPVGVLRYEPLTLDVRQELAYALQHRADLALLHALEEAIAADKQTVQAGYFPTVLLTASALLFPQSVLVSKQTSIVPGQEPRTTEEREGLALTWRIVDNGQIIGASHRLEAVRQIYVTLQHQLEQNIPRELAAIKNQLQEADARHEALLKSAEAAEEGLQLIESRVALGEATQYDFLKAQTSLLSVRASLVDATWVHETARAELDRATGRYLQYHVETAQ